MWVQALASNPLTILAVSILVLVWIGRGAMNALIETVTKLTESTTKNAENVNQLEVLYREQVTELSRSVFRQEERQNGIERRLIDIETLIREAIEDCKNDRTIK